jgi:hypothetical protein
MGLLRERQGGIEPQHGYLHVLDSDISAGGMAT